MPVVLGNALRYSGGETPSRRVDAYRRRGSLVLPGGALLGHFGDGWLFSGKVGRPGVPDAVRDTVEAAACHCCSGWREDGVCGRKMCAGYLCAMFDMYWAIPVPSDFADNQLIFIFAHLNDARMAESVDALVSNTSGAIRAGSIPAPGTFDDTALLNISGVVSLKGEVRKAVFSAASLSLPVGNLC